MRVGESVNVEICGKKLKCKIKKIKEENRIGYGEVLLITPKGSKIWRKTYFGKII